MPRQAVGRLKELWGNRRGTTAVEFALVATPLIWMLGIICETAAFIVVQYQLQYAVDRVSRLVVTNQTTGMTAQADFKSKICGFFKVTNCSSAIYVDVRSADKFADLSLPEIGAIGPATTSGTYSDTFDLGAAGKPGSLIVTYDWRFVFPFMGSTFGFNNVAGRTDVRRLSGTAIYMREKQ